MADTTKIETYVTAETCLPLTNYDDIAFVELATLEAFTAALRAAGAPDDTGIEVWFGRIVDGERWTGLKHRAAR